jgi:SAM-dependent methyltransferase
MTLLERIDRVNAAHPWSHNDHYHRWVLRNLPRRPGSVLDVGCGTGNLLRVLAPRCGRVVGVDPVPGLVRDVPPNVRVVGGSFAALPPGRYDVVVSIAAVHHADLADALSALRAASDRVLVVGCYRAATLADRLVDVVAIPANLLVGLLTSRGLPEGMTAPTAEPATTLAEVRATAARVLPGARVTRRLFWRYTLSWSGATSSTS